MSEITIEHKQPATCWAEASPLGNGFFGAMVYGNPVRERIELSALTYFSGRASPTSDVRNSSDMAFRELRRATLAKDYARAKRFAKNFMGQKNDYGTNLPTASLLIDQPVFMKDQLYKNYQRRLFLDKGLSSVDWQDEKANFHRQQVFISHIDRLLIMQRSSDRPGALSEIIHFSGENLEVIHCCKDTTMNPASYPGNPDCHIIVIRGQALESIHSNGRHGTVFVSALQLFTWGGFVLTGQGKLHIRGADSWMIKLALETDFTQKDPYQAAMDHLSLAKSRGWDDLLSRHIQDFSSLMNRVHLRLGQKAKLINTTAQNLANIFSGSNEELKQQLVALMFQYGRYLLLSSSREDSPLPAHLQGIWNDNVASRIGWTCDMHLDINTQMNYWPAEIVRLSESVEPLLRWIREKLIPVGRITASHCYGLPGWAAELVSNAWGYAAPYWSPSLCPCPTGGAWLLDQVWQHYIYHPDLNRLNQEFFPMLKEAVQFFSTYLFQTESEDYYHSGPSISPENAFLVTGDKYYASISCTYEISIIRNLYNNYLQAFSILAENNMVNPEEHNIKILVEKQLAKLVPLQIAPDGRLREWLHDYPEADPQHRHTSHLLSLYPFRQINPKTTPHLAQAAAKSIANKLNPPENWEDTGWARSLLMLYAARLLDGNSAYMHMQTMLSRLTMSNLMIKHPPTRGAPAFADVYELDGNTGITASVAEMLLQAFDDLIHLLPALPDKWQEGSFSGLAAPGDVMVSLTWQKRYLTKVVLESKCQQRRQICHGDKNLDLRLAAGYTILDQDQICWLNGSALNQK